MKLQCRKITAQWRRRQFAMTELIRHASIVTDPDKLAFLSTEVARRKARTENDRRARRRPV